MITKQKYITTPYDILELDIIDFNRLNGVFRDTREALETVFSWFNNTAVVTDAIIDDFFDAPKRIDWPGWDHCGNHPEIGELYWNWFFWKGLGTIQFSDSPDFHGTIGDKLFFGDIGKVSASTFALTQKGMGSHDLWISILDNGRRHIIVETQIDISEEVGRLIIV